MRWALEQDDDVQRVVDVLRCPCGGTRVVTVFVDDPNVLREVLGKLGLPREAPAVAKARGPPQQEFFDPVGPDYPGSRRSSSATR
jgi:hypothetical protein